MLLSLKSNELKFKIKSKLDLLWNKNQHTLNEFPDSANDNHINELKEDKLKDKHIKVALKEIFLYVAFVAMTLTVAYQMLDNDAYKYQVSLRNFFGAGTKSKTFDEVNMLYY